MRNALFRHPTGSLKMHAFAFICLAAAAPSHALLDARRVLRGSRRLDEVFPELVKLVANDAAASDNFGRSVAVDGGTIVIGAHGKDDLTGAAYVRRASDGEELAKLMASDAAAGDKFGYSVAIAGDTVVVGALEAGTGGRVYVFQKSLLGSTYDQVATLAAATAEAGDQFGASVAIVSGLTGATIVVGAPGSDGGRGAVYVFQKSLLGGTFELVVTRSADDAAAGDLFGASVAIAGGTIVVRAYNTDTAYVFRTSDGGATYGQVAKLDGSGGPVAIDGDTIVVGSNVFRTTDGGFTVVKASSGTHCGEGDAAGKKVLVPSALAATRCCGSISDSFCNNGNDLCQSGYVTYEVAKATCEDAGARLCTPDELELRKNEGGAKGTGCNFDIAYVWSSEATYGQVAKLTASDGDHPRHYFGSSVAIAGGTIVVGARSDDDAGSYAGSAYVYRTTDGATYVEVAKLTAADAASSDYFGRSVAIDGSTFVIGAPYDDDDACPYNMNCDSGSVYVFREEGSGGAAGAATASIGLIVGLVVAAAVAVVLGYLALNRFRSQSRASEQASAADAEDIKLEAAFSDAADEMAAAEPSTGQQAAP